MTAADVAPVDARKARSNAGKIIEHHFGSKPKRIVSRGGGLTNFVFEVRHAEGDFIVRMNTTPDKLKDYLKEQWAIAQASVEEIDRINILQASLLAMSRALEQLQIEPAEVQVDGLHCPPTRWPSRAIVQGDATVAAISAASILAKCHRDAVMVALHAEHPQYGFDRHKGYSTPAHLQALREHGPSSVHRRSFAPVREMLAQGRLF